jgi:hypothetical protein
MQHPLWNKNYARREIIIVGAEPCGMRDHARREIIIAGAMRDEGPLFIASYLSRFIHNA